VLWNYDVSVDMLHTFLELTEESNESFARPCFLIFIQRFFMGAYFNSSFVVAFLDIELPFIGIDGA